MNALMIYTLIALVSIDGIVSHIRDYCITQHSSFKVNIPRCEIIPQPFFDSITFWSLDTLTVVTMPDDILEPAIRVGVSNDTSVYSIFGFEKDQFNDLVSQSNIRISATNAYDYGRFFLDLHRDIDQEIRYYITSVDEFVSLNRQMMLDSIGYSHRSKTISNVEKRIRAILSPYQFGTVRYHTKEGTFLITYIVWDYYLGLLFKYEVRVGHDGKCTLEQSDLIAKDVGYWHNQRM